MNDPIKEFVEQNRAAFDELEAPAFNLEEFKARLQPVQERKSKNFWLTIGARWLVAASVLIAFGTAFLLLRENNSTPSLNKGVQMVKTKTGKTSKEIKVTETSKTPQIAIEKQFEHPVAARKLTKAFVSLPINNVSDNVYAKLSDSSSSSTRLSAILAIDKAGQISNDVLDKLAKTLNGDDNSNVRLAALSVLEKYSYDVHVAALLVHSLNTQNDPMVQLGLVTILGKMKNLNINDKLYALASDPNTFDAVKDEAYSILLKEDKL
ncbi:HEAT repeat domain-containing protein [Pedobacter mendelii]|uniref:HEAT repeat domain-containing protein n=1 Tax=Pedobacter mendelii TaxID=1908240 RepID=A0ABQ2BD00_9SPHI|nr:HEAT repeat domain-containing protein [Pedobacter mendelii]GGI23255.1 hypothetical protein GCM10008119_06750 [Pedobacter mendelii]